MADWFLRGDRGPPAKEALAFAVVLALLALAAYWAFVAHGGFYSDDWAHVAAYRFADSPRYWSSVAEFQETLGGRPLFALLLPIPQALFGADPNPHLALAVALGIATSLCFYVLLRTMEMAPLHAGTIAGLALFFPWSDSIRLWPTGSIIGVSVCLFLIGLVLALRGFGRDGRKAIAMHAAADGFYLLSVLTYETTAAAALLAGFLYLGRGSRASVARRWLADVVVVLGALVYSLVATASSRPVGSPLERLEDLEPFTRESLLLLTSAIQPYGSPGRVLQALVLLLAAAVVGAALLRLRRHRDPLLRDWVRWIAIGAATVVAAYFMFLGSNLHPRDQGIGNRINVFAGLGYCLLVYAVIGCAGRLLLRSTRLAAAATAATALAIGIGYEVRLADDESAWRAAAVRQQDLLDRIDRTVLPMPPRSTLLSFGFPAQTAPEVPIFNRSWDLSGALRLRSGVDALDAYPIYEGVDVRCGPSLVIDGGGGFGVFSIAYRRLFFFDPQRGGREIGSRAQCEDALRRFQPGPVES